MSSQENDAGHYTEYKLFKMILTLNICCNIINPINADGGGYNSLCLPFCKTHCTQSAVCISQ